MLKRPLNSRFSEAVLAGLKFTTIRDKAWPVGKPIMLYHWSGAAYRSQQSDVAAVVVEFTRALEITHDSVWGMIYSISAVEQIALWSSEGFASRAELDAWFRSLVKPGQSVVKHLMRFRLMNNHGHQQAQLK